MISYYYDHLKGYHDHCFIVGCSGGVDSMTLAHWLIANQFSVHIVHINYNKRGEASLLDEQLVEKFARKNHLAYDIYSFDVSRTSSSNFQEAARQFRYDKLQFIADLYPKSFIALAHHEGDQVETFFMNLSRKSGVLGLAAMPFQNKSIVRPFLKASKDEIVAYATENAIEWREDSSNAESNYTRNRWRNIYIPLIEESIPTLTSSVTSLITHFQRLQREIELNVEETVETISKTGKLDIVSKSEFSSLEMIEIWRQLGQPATTFEAFLELFELEKGKRCELVGDFSYALKESDYIHFSKAESITKLPLLSIEKVDALPTKFTKDVIYLDASKIKGELKIRYWNPGDFIHSLGMKGKQLVSDIIKDTKIAHHLKKSILVVCDDEAIHWVVGLKVGRLVVANEQTENIVSVQVES